MPNLRESFNPGALGLKPTEIGVDARAAAARRIGMFSNQVGGATEQLAGETRRLGSEEQGLGRETEKLGSETGQVGEAQGRALAVVGRGIGSGIHAAGDAAVKYLDHQQISHGAVALAGLMQQKTQAWNDAAKNADPNDPTVAQDFLQNNLEPDLETFKQSFWSEGARQWAESHVDAFRQHMFQKTSADMSTAAKQATYTNHAQLVNSLSATVHGDPSSLDHALDVLGSTIDTKISTSPNLSAADAGSVRTELRQKGAESIVKSAAIGYIQKTGNMPDWIGDPKYAPYVNGAELKQFQKAAEAQQHAIDRDKRATEADAQQQADKQATIAVNKAWVNNIAIDEATGGPTIKGGYFKDVLKAVQDNPDALNATQLGRTYINWGEAQLAKRVPKESDPTVKAALMDRMHDSDKPTKDTDLMQAQIEGKLSNKDFGMMNRLVTALQKAPLRDPVFTATMSAVKSQLGIDPVGLGKYADFAADFIDRYINAKRAGTLEPNALDLKNPDSMISKAMKPYQRDLMQIKVDKAMGGATAAPAPAAAPTIATKEDYDKLPTGTEFIGGDGKRYRKP